MKGQTVRGLVGSALRVSRVSHRKLIYSTDIKTTYDNYVRRKRTVPSYVQGDRECGINLPLHRLVLPRHFSLLLKIWSTKRCSIHAMMRKNDIYIRQPWMPSPPLPWSCPWQPIRYKAVSCVSTDSILSYTLDEPACPPRQAPSTWRLVVCQPHLR